MILVFGKTGQLATALFAHPSVQCVDRHEADLLQPERCASLIHDLRPEAVINAAAYTNVDAAEDNRGIAETVNALAPEQMARACKDRSIPFVHLSTDFVFDGKKGTPYTPSDPVNPINAYGETKCLGERLIQDVGGQSIIIRTSWIFAAHGSNFVRAIIERAATSDRLRVVSDQVGGPIGAVDLAEACIRVANTATSNPNLSGLYHFSGKPSVSRAEFAEAIVQEALIGCKIDEIESSEYETAAKRPLNVALDCSGFVETFGIPQPGWRTGLSTVIAAMKEA